MGTTRIIVDTREQVPWTFEGQRGIVIERAKLDAGDYSVAGLESRIAVERKSLEDWIKTTIRDRKRFYKELERLRSYELRCVIIETSIADLFSMKGSIANVNPESVLGFIAEVTVEQRVPVHLGGSRAESQIFAGALLKMAQKKFQSA